MFPYITNQIEHLAKIMNDSFRPEWCQRLRLISSLIFPLSSAELQNSQLLSELIKQAVEYCREKLPQLTYIRDPAPSSETFDFYPTRCCFAVVEFGTKTADFQLSFKFHPEKGRFT
jgi:hypothetical protein